MHYTQCPEYFANLDCHFSDIMLHTGGIQIMLFHQLRIISPPRYMTIYCIMTNFMQVVVTVCLYIYKCTYI